MNIYNGFGCKVSTIVEAYTGAISADFAGGAVDSTVIQDEIDLAVSDIISAMSPKSIQMLETVEYQAIPALLQDVSGNYSYTIFPPVLNEFYMWQVPRYNPAVNNYLIPNIAGTCGTQSDCASVKNEISPQYLFTDYTLNGSTITFDSDFDQTRNTYYMSYNVDGSSLVLNSLKGVVRDRVACVLGMQIYSRQDDVWKLVNLYCTRWDYWLSKIDEHWMPSEFKSFKYLNSPFTVAGGITTIKLGRG